MTRFWVGGYGADMDGDAEGIGLLSTDRGRGASTLAYRGVVAPAPSPSWLVPHPSLDVVYAALEGEGTVRAFVRTGEESLRGLGDPVRAGELVCHLAVSPDGRLLVASCYGDGRVVRFDIAGDGRLVAPAADRAAALRAALFGDDRDEAPSEPDTGAHRDRGTTADAGAPARAHAAAFLRDGRIATADLGRDLVRIWRRDLTLDHEVALPRGTGPRQLLVHPSGHLHVLTEHSCEVFTLAASRDGAWGLLAATSVGAMPEDAAAELAVSRDGYTLYAGLRGSNTIAALRVRGAGETVAPLALADAGVDWPRHHLVHEGVLLVAGQRSSTVSVIELDERTGAPRGVRHHTPSPSPTVIVPFP